VGANTGMLHLVEQSCLARNVTLKKRQRHSAAARSRVGIRLGVIP
jgi:hypothetical protein